MSANKKFWVAFAILFVLNWFYYLNNQSSIKSISSEFIPSDQSQNKKQEQKEPRFDKLKYIRVRDFIRYECREIERIGGFSLFVLQAPDPLYRIDGAWFVCMDGQLAPKFNECRVISFGVNQEYSFDQAMNQRFSCDVHSFDPIIEASIFTEVRMKDPKLAESTVLKVNSKWSFYKLGVTNNSTGDLKSAKMGDKLDLMSLIKLAGLENKVVDIFKIDIEGEEKGVFEDLDMEYACKYFKQFMFETHKNFKFEDLVKLEECFFMFYRHTRFFIDDKGDTPTGYRSEFQQEAFKLDLSLFKNETYLAEYMFVNGEFYFVNMNFFDMKTL